MEIQRLPSLPLPNILIIDDIGTPNLTNRPIYSKLLSPQQYHLYIITSKNGIHPEDKEVIKEGIELQDPTLTGQVELESIRLSNQCGGFIGIYCRQEDLILRVAYLRQLLRINNGLQPYQALAFRDKFIMKEMVFQNNKKRFHDGHGSSVHVHVLPYAKVVSPSTLIEFTTTHGYPIIIKPVLGSASAGVKVISNSQELENYISKDYFDSITSDGSKMDISGDYVVEKFISFQSMYHVNGYYCKGKLECIWPFKYVNTNLGFTQGSSYGNISLNYYDENSNIIMITKGLIESTLSILKSLPCPDHLIFHLELFETEPNQFTLCEIAARRPGGSISLLIDQLCSGGGDGGIGLGFFPKYDVLANLGFPLPPLPSKYFHSIPVHDDNFEYTKSELTSNVQVSKEYGLWLPRDCIGDLMVPLSKGTLISIPLSGTCPIPNIQYYPIAKIGVQYDGFHIGRMNTAARFVYFYHHHHDDQGDEQDSSLKTSTSKLLSVHDIENVFHQCEIWFREECIYLNSEGQRVNGFGKSIK